MPDRAIGIFDSGVGGLTVFQAARKILPNEEFIYLGDTARVPYGTKSPVTVLRYAQQAAAFLVRQRVKALVVACNTASSVAVPVLAKRFRLPVIGVIEPGAKRAAELTRNGKIGVIGTEGTVKSEAYPQAIRQIDPDLAIFSVPCPLFVPLAEEGWAEHPVARMCAEEYLAPLLREGVDTLVLGCTHYPLLKPTLQQLLGDQVRLVDSAEATAKEILELLTQRQLFRRTPAASPKFFVTDVPTRFCRVGGAFLGGALTDVQQVDIDH